MLFNSVSYVLFLVGVTAAFWLTGPRWRVWLLLAASAAFYGLWRPEFLLLVAFSAAVDFYLALKIGAEHRAPRRRLWVVCSVSVNLLLLGYFKYAYFIAGNLEAIARLLGAEWSIRLGTIILPLGISFYTFLSISYTIDVYRGLCAPVRNFAVYLTYVMFWPHMVAGPILRANELIPQLVSTSRFDLDRVAGGVKRILFGLFLKVGPADHLAPFVDDWFLMSPASLSALDVWTMAFAFGLQIYFDFAGYSMIAIGSARLLGVHFPENFNWPYLATSPRAFWKSWHITLSSWIRDYLYLPLCGARFRDRSEGGLETDLVRPGSLRLTGALFATWGVMGLWHGAAWTFVLWGLWHAAFIWIYRITAPLATRLPDRLRSLIGWGVTVAVSMLGWILFRSRSVEDAFSLLGRVCDRHAYASLGFRESAYLLVAVLFAGMLALHFAFRFLANPKLSRSRRVMDTMAIAVSAFLVFILLRPVSLFIYFQF
ncbi:MBOAT family O-acyltransferase [Bradyrhizobium sp.]|uniref:MBOAT family O-acyltransferase n=1 Tax=Bradyrhizobium sp. TaxID=376 RepID=UPI003C77D52D